jgi:hypothetical protein
MRVAAITLVCLCLLEASTGFTIAPRSVVPRGAVLSSSTEDDDQPLRLVLSQDEMQQQMSKLRSKYPTAEADYLAAARARSTAKMASQERKATDGDYQELAEEKHKTFGETDDWEDSKKEAGNGDSQILIPMMDSTEDGEEDEPKLLLF